MMGTVGNDGPNGESSVDIFTADTLRGELKFVATNDVGPRWNLHFYNVEFAPSGSFNPISDEWNNIEVTGEVLIAPTGHAKAGKVGLAWLTRAAFAAVTVREPATWSAWLTLSMSNTPSLSAARKSRSRASTPKSWGC